jgi:ferric-dicitrate binding protein FerR (iron transport regulator)
MAVDQSGSRALDSVLVREAAAYLEQLYSEDLTESAFADWLQWLALSESHLRCYWGLEELWRLFDQAPPGELRPGD